MHVPLQQLHLREPFSLWRQSIQLDVPLSSLRSSLASASTTLTMMRLSDVHNRTAILSEYGISKIGLDKAERASLPKFLNILRT